MVMENLIWAFMVCMILCALVWFSIVYYANIFPCKVLNGLFWLYMVLYGLTQLCIIFVLVLESSNKATKILYFENLERANFGHVLHTLYWT